MPKKLHQRGCVAWGGGVDKLLPSWLQVHYHRADTNQWISDSDPEIVNNQGTSNPRDFSPFSPQPYLPQTVIPEQQSRHALLRLYQELDQLAPELHRCAVYPSN